MFFFLFAHARQHYRQPIITVAVELTALVCTPSTWHDLPCCVAQESMHAYAIPTVSITARTSALHDKQAQHSSMSRNPTHLLCNRHGLALLLHRHAALVRADLLAGRLLNGHLGGSSSKRSSALGDDSASNSSLGHYSFGSNSLGGKGQQQALQLALILLQGNKKGGQGRDGRGGVGMSAGAV
jgi:hypothetical protein